eukprot:15441994-Alexandrium_andersonii.AAC.1
MCTSACTRRKARRVQGRVDGKGGAMAHAPALSCALGGTTSDQAWRELSVVICLSASTSTKASAPRSWPAHRRPLFQ